MDRMVSVFSESLDFIYLSAEYQSNIWIDDEANHYVVNIRKERECLRFRIMHQNSIYLSLIQAATSALFPSTTSNTT